MSSYALGGYMGTGLIPLNTANLELDTLNRYMKAAVAPIATGHWNTSVVTPTITWNGAHVDAHDSGNLFDRDNHHAYAWTVNVTDVRFPAGSLPRSYSNGNRSDQRQITSVYGLAMSEANVERLASAGRSLRLFIPLRLPDDAIKRGQHDNGNCHATLGAACAHDLTIAVNNRPLGIPSMPASCKHRLGQEYAGAVSMGVSNAFTSQAWIDEAVNVTTPRIGDITDQDAVNDIALKNETNNGVVGNNNDSHTYDDGDSDSISTVDSDAEGFWFTDGDVTNGVRTFNTGEYFLVNQGDNYVVRNTQSALYHQGSNVHGEPYLTRSSIFSRGFDVTDLEFGNDDRDRDIALRAVQPIVVSEYDLSDPEGPAIWSSMTCVRANELNANIESLGSDNGYGDGYTSGADSIIGYTSRPRRLQKIVVAVMLAAAGFAWAI